MNPFYYLGLAAAAFGFSKTSQAAPADASQGGGDVSPSTPSSSDSSDPWTRYDESFKRFGNLWGVDWKRLKAHAIVESNLGQNKRVKNQEWSYDGLSLGLMQITLETATGLDPNVQPSQLAQIEPDADFSINLAAQLIAQNMREFSQLLTRYDEWVTKRYNGSHHAVQNQIDGIPNGLNSRGEDIDELLNNYYAKWTAAYAKVEANS